MEQNFQYNNRELDWLYFNGRVLQEAEDSRNPLYARLRFLAIFSSNLDEFFRVRISKIRQLKKIRKKDRKPLRLRPNKLLKALLPRIHQQQERLGKIFRQQLVPELKRHGIHLIELGEYSEARKLELEGYFRNEIRPALQTMEASPINTDSFEDGRLYLVACSPDYQDLRFVLVPTANLGRFIAASSIPGQYIYTYLEDIMKLNIQEIWPTMDVSGVYNIKLSKDAELYLEDDYEGEWVVQIYESLKRRQLGQPTRLLYEKGMPAMLVKRLQKILALGKADLMEGGDRHNFSDFLKFPKPVQDDRLDYEPMPPLKHPDFEPHGSLFNRLDQGDLLMHFPYQDFGHVEHWLMEAAEDPKVTSFHISLYRIAKESKLTAALLRALDNKKEVHIFVEAKARFDEKNNIQWGRKFEERGAMVYYSFQKVKVHSKILLIKRKESSGPRGYAYIGTGNFNAKTARVYVDHALFTAQTEITEDLEQVFGVLKRNVLLPKLTTLLIAPYNLRNIFEALIQREIDNAQQGLPAKIIAKMNSLEDIRMINWLYRANNAGVSIELIIRGFCCLVPGIPGQSEHIKVTSIVDRFLEHGRVFLFHNGGAEAMFMGSADWMGRNLDRRIEVVTPVLDANVFHELRTILKLQLLDNQKARKVDAENRNGYVRKPKGTASVRSQYAIYHYLWEKGRGKLKESKATIHKLDGMEGMDAKDYREMK